MKTLIIFGLITLFIGGCIHTCTIKEVKELTHKVDSLEKHTQELKKTIKFLDREIDLRESEISYWGHKYDSCRVSK
jgi:predicted RNase H-like nuclease (RuvC/YqgF family)